MRQSSSPKQACGKLIFLVIVSLWGSVVLADTASEWTPLFNGKNLTGWYTVLSGHERDSDPDHLVQIHDGMIHIYKDAPDKTAQSFGYIATRNEFSNYRVRIEYKWGKKQFAPRATGLRDAGLLYHVHGNDSARGVWPLCVECQIQEGNTGDLISVGTKCTSFVSPETKDEKYPKHKNPKTGGLAHENEGYIYADKVCDRLDDWNMVEIVVHGSEESTHVVNGQVDQTAKNFLRLDSDNWVPLKKGHVALQIEGAEIFYRKIEIQSLDANASLLNGEKASASEADSSTTAGPESKSAKFEPPPLEVPSGFEVSVAATPPLVEHPMMACLDDRGRLFISESDGKNREAQQLIQDHPHKILMLEDTDGDGVYDKRSVFAEGLLLPNGAEWYDGALYVCSAPYIWRFRDTDGDGRADEATKIIGTFNFDGRSSAFHGPQLGPDGRLYWSGGQHGWMLENPRTTPPRALADPKKLGYDAAYAGPWTRYTPGTFSCWPDGSDPENLAYGGICNPVETAFTPEGEVIGTVSVYDYLDSTLRRDAVLHWIDGGVFNLAEKNYVGVIRTGKDLTPVSYRGHSAPAGIARYRGAQLGPDYRDNFLFAEFNTHKVYRLHVERDGASFRSRDEVFLSSSDTDTHFTDIIEDADGSLLVIDTGGWFMYGCPTSQIAKPSIKGAIYRVRKKGVPKVEDPRGQSLPWVQASDEELTKRLADSRFVVVDRAITELSKRGASAVPALRQALHSGSPEQRLQCVWVLTRIHDDKARSATRSALDDADMSVRLAALHSVAVHRDSSCAANLIDLLSNASPAIRREAATAIGRIRTKQAVAPLLHAAATASDDRFLEHAITMALIRIGDGTATVAGLRDQAPAVRRTALIALDQMKSDELTQDMLSPMLESGDESLEQAAIGVLRNRPEWAGEIATRLGKWLATPTPTPAEETKLRGAIRAFWSNPAVETLVAEALHSDSTSEPVRLSILDAMSSVDANKLPNSWVSALGDCLNRPQIDTVRQAIATISARNLTDYDSVLEAKVHDADVPNSLRLTAAMALSRRIQRLSDDAFALLVKECHTGAESVDRLGAAQSLASAHLTEDQRQQLSSTVADAGPLDLPVLIGVFEGGTNEVTGARLVEALTRSPGLNALPSSRLAKVLQTYPSEVQRNAKPLLARLGASVADQSKRLVELQAKMSGGDAKRGHDVFYGPRASCSACHRIGTQGGTIGPNLSAIGQIRTVRDLLEAVVFPSASFARGFEPYEVQTKDGKIFSGILSRDTPQAIALRCSDRSEIRIPRNEIEEIRAGTVSIMPQGFDKQLGDDQLCDLIAFLLLQK